MGHKPLPTPIPMLANPGFSCHEKQVEGCAARGLGSSGETLALCACQGPLLQLRGLEPGGLGVAFPLSLWIQKCTWGVTAGRTALPKWTPGVLLRPGGDPMVGWLQTAPPRLLSALPQNP